MKPSYLVIDDSYKIVVDIGPFSAPIEAASSENGIDWSGSNISAMNACTESYAAFELHHYLGRLANKDAASDSDFQIVPFRNYLPEKAIILGNLSQIGSNEYLTSILKRKKVIQPLDQPESFAIIPEKSKLYIIGHDRIGTLYGVYHFLERLGVRWYEPGIIGEIIPHIKQIIVPGEMIIETPDYLTRGFWAWEDRGHKAFYIWMARNRFNFWTIAEPNHAHLRKLGIQLTVGGHTHFERFLNPEDEYPYNHPLFEGDEDKSIDPYKINKIEYKGDVNKDNKLTYFEAHPEWYGLINGKREIFRGDYGTNICTSNNDAVSELCRKLINELADGQWKDANSLNFWPLDVAAWCECQSCSLLGTPTDRLLLLEHQIYEHIRVAKKEGKINRDIKLIFPIYQETLTPPTRPLPENFDYEQVIGTFFPIHRCYVHALDDSSCTEINRQIWENFLGWTKKESYYQGQIFIGEYYNVSKIKSLPVIYTNIMRQDIPLFYKFGARHFHYMHVYTKLLGMKRMNNYLLAKLLWNTVTNVDLVLKKYFEDYYGESSEQMAHLYNRLECAMSNIKMLKHVRSSLRARIDRDLEPLFNSEHLKLEEYHPDKNDGVDLEESVLILRECRQIMDSVLAKNQPEVLAQRLAQDNQNLRYAENTYNFYYYVSKAIEAKRAGDWEQAKKFYDASCPFAEALKEEREIVQTSSSHANATDGLTATYIEKKSTELGIELAAERAHID